MKQARDFPNMKLDCLRAHPSLDILAAVGSRSCIVMSSSLDVVQRHLDANTSESLHCCAFADVVRGIALAGRGRGTTGGQGEQAGPVGRKRNLLCVAGEAGIIKILDLNRGRISGFLRGHTGAVYDLLAFEHILVSCSGDGTARLWDLRCNECIGVLGGMHGHRDHILSLDLSHAADRLVSAGTDSTIKQWGLDLGALARDGAAGYTFLQAPLQSFANVHRSTITKVKYHGRMILSLCDHVISAIYDISALETLEGLAAPGLAFRLAKDTPIFAGSINLYDNCKTFTVVNHVLVGISTSGDIYLFDLHDLGVEKTPYIIRSNLGAAEDFVMLGEEIYITTGSAIHRLPIDMSRFSDKDDDA